MSDYYQRNQLRPNPTKTQLSAFHLRNRDASYKLQVDWEGTPLEHAQNPVYLGVTLDRTLSYKKHAHEEQPPAETKELSLGS